MFHLRVANHELKVVIRVDASAQILVVVFKLLNRYDLIALVRLPNCHKVRKHLICSLVSTLEVWMEADIVCNSDIINGDLAGTILVKDTISLMNHVKTTLVERAADSAQKLIERQLTILVCIKVLNDLGDLNLREVKTIVTHGVLELDRAQTTIAVTIHGSEHGAKTTKAVGATLFAQVNNLLFDFIKVADLNMLLHVWVSDGEITARSARKVNDSLLLFEVDVSLVAHHSLGLVERLGHSAGAGKRVWTSCSAHVSVLSLKSLCVNRNGPCLSVVTLRDSSHKLLIGCFSSTSVHALLDDELIVTSRTSDELSVLSLHDLAPDGVCSHVLSDEVLTIGSIKVTLFIPGINRLLSFTHLLHDLPLDVPLQHLVLASDSGNTISLALSSAILSVVGVEELLVGLTIDSIGRVVEHFSLDGVLEVVMLLGDVSLSHSSIS